MFKKNVQVVNVKEVWSRSFNFMYTIITLIYKKLSSKNLSNK